jgi:hypothetical protein
MEMQVSAVAELSFSDSGLAYSSFAHSGLAYSGLAYSGLAYGSLAYGNFAYGSLAHSSFADGVLRDRVDRSRAHTKIILGNIGFLGGLQGADQALLFNTHRSFLLLKVVDSFRLLSTAHWRAWEGPNSSSRLLHACNLK